MHVCVVLIHSEKEILQEDKIVTLEESSNDIAMKDNIKAICLNQEE